MNFRHCNLPAPPPVRVALMPCELDFIKDVAEKRARHRQYEKRKDRWAKSYIRAGRNGLDGSTTAIFTGTCGEFALCSIANDHFGRIVARLDTRLRKRGDDGADVIIFGIRHQVKTRTCFRENNFITTVNDKGVKLDIFKSHITVFIEFNDNSRNVVDVLGWVHTRSLKRYPDIPPAAPKGKHKMLEVPNGHLLPMYRLMEFLELRDPERKVRRYPKYQGAIAWQSH
jgi:hypothetical protein